MITRRRQHNLTVLADGSVLATGGQKTNGGGGLVDLANAVYTAERWDPATGAWTELAAAAVARQYHSVALLLPDGRVLTGGGGICGVCQQVGYLRRDFEVFTPPYLYRKDGSGQLAPRPEITGAPGDARLRRRVHAHRRRDIRKLALVRLGAPTHSEDQSQRYVPLQLHRQPARRSPSPRRTTRNEAPAGHYMLFAVDAAGVPIDGRDRPASSARPSPRRRRHRSTSRSTGRDRQHRRASAPKRPAKAVNGSVSRRQHRQVLHQGLRHPLAARSTSARAAPVTRS